MLISRRKVLKMINMQLFQRKNSIINNNQGQLSLKRHKVAYQTIYVSETSENIDS